MVATDSPLELDATAQAALVRNGAISPIELVDLALARIDTRNPALNAVIHRRDERARAAAVAVDPSAPVARLPPVAAVAFAAPTNQGASAIQAAGVSTRFDETVRLVCPTQS